MNKLTQLKEVMKNPPPERLAKIEYQSHRNQALGIIFVCIILLAKGYWYIIFALIFGVGVSYSQGMTAYQKHKNIVSILGKEKPSDFEKDISPTRRRNKIIESVIGQSKWLSIFVSVITSVLIIDNTLSRWILSIVYPLTIMLIYIIFHFFILYWACYPAYKKNLRIDNDERR